MIEKIKRKLTLEPHFKSTWGDGVLCGTLGGSGPLPTTYSDGIKLKLILIDLIRQFGGSGIDKKGAHYYNDCALRVMEDVFKVFGFTNTVSSKELDEIEELLRKELEAIS